MKWNKQFEYPASMRTSIEGKRHYEITGKKLPSVTTILQATKSQEAIDSINRWQKRVGEIEAERVKNTAASRGTNMHYHLENSVHKTISAHVGKTLHVAAIRWSCSDCIYYEPRLFGLHGLCSRKKLHEFFTKKDGVVALRQG